jgi:hypothetical protein
VGRGYPPVWHPGSKRHPTLQPGARWHAGSLGLAQYFSLEGDGAWAELLRYEGVRTDRERLGPDLRRRFWKCEVEDHDIADLSSFDEIAELGLDPEQIIADDHVYCRDLALELEVEGYRGVVAPSAAVANVLNLTLFGPRRDIPSHSMRGPNRRPEVFIPVAVIADDAAAPGHVVGSVRYFGDPHVGYEDWKATRSHPSIR